MKASNINNMQVRYANMQQFEPSGQAFNALECNRLTNCAVILLMHKGNLAALLTLMTLLCSMCSWTYASSSSQMLRQERWW